MNRNRIAVRSGVAVIVAAAFVAIAACSNEVAGTPTANPADSAEVAPTPAPVTEEPEPTPLDLDDFIATLKVTEKQCFGSAGCNVTVEPNLEYVHALDTLENRTFSITLTITGDESGPVITTINGTGTQYDMMPVFLSTRGSGVRPKAKVTEVQEY